MFFRLRGTRAPPGHAEVPIHVMNCGLGWILGASGSRWMDGRAGGWTGGFGGIKGAQTGKDVC